MPNFYAHLRFCQGVLEQAPPALRGLLEQDRDALLCGSLGPDPLYFYFEGLWPGRIRRAGLELHHHSGAAALERFRRPVKERWPHGAAFAAGYLLHFLLDTRCHPFIRQVAARGTYTHFALEGEYDRYLLRRDQTDYAAVLPTKQLPRSLYVLGAEMANPVTPEIYQKALADFRRMSLKLTGWAGKPVRHVVNAASRIPPARPIRGMILAPRPDPKIQRYLLTLDRLTDSAARDAAAELEAFFRAVEEDRPFSRTLDRDFSGNEV